MNQGTPRRQAPGSSFVVVRNQTPCFFNGIPRRCQCVVEAFCFEKPLVESNYSTVVEKGDIKIAFLRGDATRLALGTWTLLTWGPWVPEPIGIDGPLPMDPLGLTGHCHCPCMALGLQYSTCIQYLWWPCGSNFRHVARTLTLAS